MAALRPAMRTWVTTSVLVVLCALTPAPASAQDTAPLYVSADPETGQLEIIESANLLAWAGIFYVAFASSLVGHAGIYYLLQRYEVSQTAPLTLLAPLFTVFFGVMLLDDTITTRMIIGGLVSLVGVLIVNIRQARKEEPFVDVGPR